MTGVGGTNALLTAANALADQTVWNDAPYDVTAGGGGYSGLFSRPSYQNGLVSRNRRAVPDVSMLADVLPGYDIYCTAPECLAGGSGPWIAVGGTSAASPLLAGGLALIDELLRTHGKQNLGLANSLLYKVAKDDASSGAIVDVTTNDNDLGPYLSGGGHHALGCCSAHAGFDLASGLGTVDLGKLAFLATGLQPAISKATVSLPSQRPVAHGYLTVKLRCNGRCVTEAVAQIKIAGARSLQLSSESHVLGHAGRKTVKIRSPRPAPGPAAGAASSPQGHRARLRACDRRRRQRRVPERAADPADPRLAGAQLHRRLSRRATRTKIRHAGDRAAGLGRFWPPSMQSSSRASRRSRLAGVLVTAAGVGL